MLTPLAERCRTSLHDLITQAAAAGLIRAGWVERLAAARQLRNRLAHGDMGGALTPGIVADLLEAAHQVVFILFPEPATRPPISG